MTAVRNVYRVARSILFAAVLTVGAIVVLLYIALSVPVVQNVIKQEAENIFSAYGLSLTDAFNIFLQQSLNSKGFPFLLSPENAEYMRSKATAQLMAEIDKGWKSAEEGGWLTLEEVESQLGLTDA